VLPLKKGKLAPFQLFAFPVRKRLDFYVSQTYTASMKLDHDTCYRALQTRDSRFDGHFFTAVKTTGIYCRPICPARAPKSENCQFYLSAAAAQTAGFRPCLRCRPELTPQFVSPGSEIVTRALHLIADGQLAGEGTIAQLAAQLAVGERQLRRLFAQQLGASPVAIAQTHRFLFAKQLLTETTLPITDVALAAGFNSLRRFNTVIQKECRRSPRELRRHTVAPTQTATGSIPLKLAFMPPYNWAALVGFLMPRLTAGIEVITPHYYQRTIALNGGHGLVTVRPVSGQPYLLADIQFPQVQLIGHIVERLRRLFDLTANVVAIAAHLGQDPRLQPAIAARPGLRVPGAWDGFELAVRAILGQQISVAAATTLAGRLVAAYGEPLQLTNATATPLGFVFPTPAELAQADLTTIGVTRPRAAAIAALATAVIEQPQLLRPGRNLADAVKTLVQLPGIGDWTAHYIAMRTLREPDAFPASDLGLLKAVSPGLLVTKSELLAMAESWRPWRAYAAMYLWSATPEVINGITD
jgi:AraC family transcriptional regulator, regulatory protein of adaptative response / DNA-3-methyladenine glycosylase II